MHVCHFCDTSLAGDYFRNIAAGLSGKGVQVSLLELGSGVEPEWLSQVPRVPYSSLGLSRKAGMPKATLELVRFMRGHNVDLLHTHLFYAGLMGALAGKFHKGTQIALMRHHTGVVRMLGSRFHVAADKWMAENAAHVMTVSEAARQYMLEVDGIRRQDIEVVHLGFDFDRFKADPAARSRVRAELGLESGDVVVGYVGAVVPGKGHSQLVRAFRSVISEEPDTKLLLVGKGSLPEVDSAINDLPENSVIATGWRVDVESCLNAMDIFVQPSLSEAFSQVLIEAMGCALPVIATDVGGAREVIENGVNGVIVPADEVEFLAREIIQLIKDPNRRGSLAERGARSVRERFGVGQMVSRHIELYERWLS
jgi:glycosyltransferase involved in cell wall biosynthesis